MEVIYFNSVIAVTERETILLYVEHIEGFEDSIEFITEEPSLEESWAWGLPKEQGIYTCKININGDNYYTPDGVYDNNVWLEITEVVKVDIKINNKLLF